MNCRLALSVALATALVLLLVSPDSAFAPPTVGDVEPGVRAPVDLTSVDSVIEALYGSISGPAGAPRDWGLFHRLMHPTAARLISMAVTTPSPSPGASTRSSS